MQTLRGEFNETIVCESNHPLRSFDRVRISKILIPCNVDIDDLLDFKISIGCITICSVPLQFIIKLCGITKTNNYYH